MAAAPFPDRAESEWCRAAEAALKGGAFDKLASVTSDGLKLGPLHSGAHGPRALRGEAGPWKALTRLDHPNPSDFNAQALEDLQEGADGLSVVFAGSGAAYGFGLARADAAGLHQAFAGVHFEGVRVSLEIAGPGQTEAVAAWLERSGMDVGALDVSFSLDPLGAQARAGTAHAEFDLKAAATNLRRRGFRGPLAAADARGVHDAGGTPAQELAFALAAGVSYLLALEDLAAIEFRLAADADQIATLAKFRAMRLLWARVEEACGLAPAPIRLAASSAWRMTTIAEPYVNVMRAALAAFAAGLGGADSVTLLPFSQAVGLPDAFARRLARNTQLVELREARLGYVADPAAGAGAIESLTLGLAEIAWALFQSYEAMGGLATALELGRVQEGIVRAADALRSDVARGKAPLTGVTAHPHLDGAPIAVLPDAPAMPIAGAGALAPFRVSEPFERLRARAKERRATIFLVALGPASAHARRLGFAREAFEAGGLAAVVGTGEADAAALGERFRASGAPLACLCGADEAYADRAEVFAAALKSAGARAVYLAGSPGDREAAWRAAGVDGFVYAGADLAAALEDALTRAG